MSATILRALLLVLLFLAPAVGSAQGLRVVARVNDDAITDFELAQRIRRKAEPILREAGVL